VYVDTHYLPCLLFLLSVLHKQRLTDRPLLPVLHIHPHPHHKCILYRYASFPHKINHVVLKGIVTLTKVLSYGKMNWKCKLCKFRTSKRLDLLKHCRLTHEHLGRVHSIPCLYADCPCTVKTWGALRTHLSRHHSQSTQPGHIISFTCIVCNSCSFDNERHFFEHLGGHLKKFETVTCVFEGCDYKTNKYTTFHSHKSRRHNPHLLEDFKTNVLNQHQNNPDEERDFVEDENDCGLVLEEDEDFNKIITNRVGLLLLKMENIFNVSNSCINELVEEFNFLTASASGPVIKEIILSTLRKHRCTFEDSVISELVKDLCQLSPVCAALRVDGPFSSKFRREQFSKEHLSLIEPVEYILDRTEKK